MGAVTIAYSLRAENIKGKSYLRPRRKWKDNIKVDL
jgi:hypothetical protein